MSTARLTAAERPYRPDLDGIRALAILSVVLYHAGLPHLTGGFSGVDIFFALSGYLIGGHIYADLCAGTFSFARFYRRRAKRILPAFFAVLAFTLAVAMILLSPAEAADLGRSAFAATVSVSNILFWGTTNYFAGKSSINPMLMTWSLGVEEQFYAVIPLLMVFLARIRRSWILPATLAVCMLSFVFASAESGSHPMMVFYLLPARAWELGAGVALAIAERNRNSALLPARLAGIAGLSALALILAPILLLNATSAFPSPAALPSVLGTALAIAAQASWVNRKILSFKPLVFIGKVSYSFYLWHWPLLAFLHILYGGDPPRPMCFAAIAVSFTAAIGSYHFIEQPFRRSRLASAPLLIRYGAASATALAACALVWLSKGVPQRFPALALMEQADQALKSDPCLAGYGSEAPNLSALCFDQPAGQPASAGRSAPGARPVLALWGDSHSAALAPGLRSAALAQGYGFAQLGKASCAPLNGATHFTPRIPTLAAECMRFNQRALAVIQSDARIRIVIFNGDWAGYLYRDWQDGWLTASVSDRQEAPASDASRALFIESLTATIRTIQSAGKQVIVLKDVPGFEVDPMWRTRTQQIPARRALSAWLRIPGAADPGSAAPAIDSHIALADSLLEVSVDDAPGASLIDLRSALCSGVDECAYRDGQRLLYDDTNHLSTAGALYAVRDLRLPEVAKTGR
jgi:peptidoglycan/LPS O-acetylase OafA/YrhL